MTIEKPTREYWIKLKAIMVLHFIHFTLHVPIFSLCRNDTQYEAQYQCACS